MPKNAKNRSKTLYFSELSWLLCLSSSAELLGVDSSAARLPQGLALVDEQRLDDGELEMVAFVETRERKKRK